jgi:hypothetical protein
MNTLQDLFALALSIKYKDIAGYTQYVNTDKMREHVFLNYQTNLKTIGIATYRKYYYKIFYDYQSYIKEIEYNKQQKTPFKNYFNETKYDENDIYDYTEKLYNHMIEYATNEDVPDFYTNSDKQIFTLYYSDLSQNKILEGGYYNKYIKYKQKYLLLQQKLKYSNIKKNEN